MAPTFLHPVAASLFDAAPADHAGVPARIWSSLRRFGDAVIAARRARAERQIAQFIENRGGRITDELEREISQRFSSPVA